MPWHPDDSLHGARRDSAIARNLTRTDKDDPPRRQRVRAHVAVEQHPARVRATRGSPIPIAWVGCSRSRSSTPTSSIRRSSSGTCAAACGRRATRCGSTWRTSICPGRRGRRRARSGGAVPSRRDTTCASSAIPCRSPTSTGCIRRCRRTGGGSMVLDDQEREESLDPRLRAVGHGRAHDALASARQHDVRRRRAGADREGSRARSGAGELRSHSGAERQAVPVRLAGQSARERSARAADR